MENQGEPSKLYGPMSIIFVLIAGVSFLQVVDHIPRWNFLWWIVLLASLLSSVFSMLGLAQEGYEKQLSQLGCGLNSVLYFAIFMCFFQPA